MIDEYEFYHGAVLRQLIVECGAKLEIIADDVSGRIDSFSIKSSVAIHIKHSTKRLSPWQFTFTKQNVEELIRLDNGHKALFICLVCSDDGVIVLAADEFLEISGPAKSETFWIRVGRQKKTMYEVTGNAGALKNKKARGLTPVLNAIRE